MREAEACNSGCPSQSSGRRPSSSPVFPCPCEKQRSEPSPRLALFLSSSTVADEEEDANEKEIKPSVVKAPIFVFHKDTEKPTTKKGSDPKIAKNTPNYKLPTHSL